MEVLNKDEFLNKKRVNLRKLKDSIFIYPTDTIYGIGCDARDDTLVEAIRGIKERFSRPFSVIAPSKDWIRDNCVVNKNVEEWLDKLPGPYTLILKLKDKNMIADSVNMDKDTLGVRIPDNWFTEVVSQLGFPIVTTSANLSGGDFMTSLDNLDRDIERKVDLIVYDGELQGSPSTLVFLDKEKPEIKKRD